MTMSFLHPLRRLHRDDRGNIGILLLLTIMALAALIGMVWNTAEYTARKRHVQNATDSAAQAATLWSSRATNIVASTNMVLAENASAEVIWRSGRDTVNGVNGRLNGERNAIQRMLDNIQRQQDRNNNNPRGPDANLALKLQIEANVLAEALKQLPFQSDILQEIVDRIAPAYNNTQETDFANTRAQMFDYQEQILGLTDQVVEEQRSAMAGFYKCDVTIATPPGTTEQASARVHAPVKTVDHTNVDGVTHPGVNVPDSDGNAWVGGGTWGSLLCPPLARYFNDRVNRDAATARQDSIAHMLRNLDDERTNLGTLINQLLTPANNAKPDVVTAFNAARPEIQRMRLDQRFAEALWWRIVDGNRHLVLWNLGEGELHVLSTYGYYNVPDWAKPGVYQDAYNYVYNWVYQHNYQRLWNQKYNELRGQRDGNGKAKYSDGEARQRATAWATRVTTQGATQIAQEAAQEWISRTWPYEITPPPNPVPPTAGLTKNDRLTYFTMLTAARTTDQTAPTPLFAKLFVPGSQPMVAYAQAETMNWMEFNGGYGASDRYDVRTPPSPWRVSTIGGWNWQPKLALSDALYPALQNNPEFRAYFEDAGISGSDPDAINQLILH